MNAVKEAAKELFARFWEWRLEESPEFATFIGNYKYDAVLESYSLDSFDRRIKDCKLFVADAVKLLSENHVDEQTRSNLKLFVTELNTYLKGMEAKGYFFCLSYMDGIQVDLEQLISHMLFKTPDDYRNLISRFKNVPKQITEIIELLKEGIRLNMTAHEISMAGVLKQLDDHQVNVEKSPLFKPFLEIPSHFDTAEVLKLKTDAEYAILRDVLPSFQKLKDFLISEYFQHLRPSISVSSLPNGDNFYLRCLNFHLGFSISPHEVYDLGIKEVEHIKKEIENCVEQMELTMSAKEFSILMKNDKDFYFNDAEEILETYIGIIKNTIRPKLKEIIEPLPTLPLSIEPAPPSRADGPSAYYLAGTPDGKRPGVFYVNTGQLASCPKYDMLTLALHEAEPGHHLQNSYLLEMEDVPDFRRFIEDRKYMCSPSRFSLHTAYTEGWGLYSEYLGYELNLYEDPFFEYGHLSHELFRACRLVVDTGIHAFGWTREQALNYMTENTAIHEAELELEINRYITWPGQACAYKIGELKIKELRKKAELALKNEFDIRKFHAVILRNPGPLNLLEQKVDAYIRKQKQQSE